MFFLRLFFRFWNQPDSFYPEKSAWKKAEMKHGRTKKSSMNLIKTIASGIVANMLGLISFSGQAAVASAEQVFAQVSASIITVTAVDEAGEPKAFGSGVAVATNTVITNCHVIQGQPGIRVIKGRSVHIARLLYQDADRDLCLLSVPSLITLPAVRGSVKSLRSGQKVYAIGAPEGLELSITEGIISSLRPMAGSELIQTSASISHGSSGGGLFDEKGNLVGITSYSLVNGQNLNFALPVDWVSQDLDRVKSEGEACANIAECVRRIQGKIRQHTTVPPDLVGNPEARYQVILLLNGEVMSVRLVKSSGNPIYDESVKRAIYMASPLPIPADPILREQFRKFVIICRPH